MSTLRQWRMSQHPKMSQDELAARLGISRPYLSQLETGSRQPSLGVALRIQSETAFAVTAADLLTIEANPSAPAAETGGQVQ